jgi:G6PDH family F420-dependent oxidoreductase
MTGEKAVEKLAVAADHLINVAPDRAVVDGWHQARQATGVLPEGRVIGQLPVCWDPDRDAAIQRAHDQFRWFGGGWAVNADLPTPASFAAASQYVRPEDVAESIPCGPDLDTIVAAVAPFVDAGFTDVALVQIGDQGQQRFLDEAAKPLLAALRAEFA